MSFDSMKKSLSVLLFITAAIPAFAQTRDDIHIFIPPVIARPDQATFFKENFEMETAGAGYSIIDSADKADYTLKLEVKPNMVLYDDGTEEQAPPDEPQFILQINLIRNEDDVEVVAFSFPFDQVEEMNNYNLYLLYEAMANVPLTKLASGDYIDDRWRNKWVYVRTSIDYPVTFYALVEPSYLWYEDNGGIRRVDHLEHRISPWLAASVGIEFQYLNFMSTELCFNLSFSDPMSNAFVPAVVIEQKFPIKPMSHAHFMIEPYVAISFPMNTSPDVISFPMFGVGGGGQFGVKGGSMGAFFIDVNFIYYPGDVVMRNNNKPYENPGKITYTRFVLGLGLGYKIGIADRPVNNYQK